MPQHICGCVRVQRHAGLAAKLADPGQRAVQMRAGLGMDSDDLGTGVGIGIQQRIRIGHHQVRIEQLVGNRAKRLDHRRAKGQVRHKMAVHHIEMDPVCAGAVDGRHLVGQSGEIRCKDGRGDDDAVGQVSLR